MNPTPAPKYVIWNHYFACNQCNDPNTTPFIWCDHIKDRIQENFDSGFLHPGMRINVPIMPDEGIWVEVVIAQDNLPGGMARMEMEYKPEFANVKKVDLGYWNPGEGLWVMRTCIVDYIKSKLPINEEVTKATPIVARCPSTASHNLGAIRFMMDAGNDVQVKWKCLWNIVMEGACTYCIQLSSDPSNSGLNAPLNTAPWNPVHLTQCNEPIQGSQVVPPERCAYPQGHTGPHRA